MRTFKQYTESIQKGMKGRTDKDFKSSSGEVLLVQSEPFTVVGMKDGQVQIEKENGAERFWVDQDKLRINVHWDSSDTDSLRSKSFKNTSK